MHVEYGATRLVFLSKHHAWKVPQFRYSWRNFLYGLLANMQERTFARTGWPELCPVCFSLPGGFLVVMERCAPVPLGTWPFVEQGGDHMSAGMFDEYIERGDYVIPVENKRDSFGIRNGRIVAVDYGSWGN